MRTARTIRMIGIQSSSRAGGLAVAAAPGPPVGAGVAVADGPLDGPAEPEGAADPEAAPPSASIRPGEPGAMFDSAASKRSTAKRAGAFGSAGGAVGAGLAEAPASRLAGWP